MDDGRGKGSKPEKTKKVQHKGLRINISFVSPDKMRYPSLGDYFWDKENQLSFVIVDTGDPIYNMMILIHEMGEELLTRWKGISETDIFKYDNHHQMSEDPGDEPDCIYRDEHCFMTGIERLFMGYMGLCWQDYIKRQEELMR